MELRMARAPTIRLNTESREAEEFILPIAQLTRRGAFGWFLITVNRKDRLTQAITGILCLFSLAVVRPDRT
jgi:hypothetical protein